MTVISSIVCGTAHPYIMSPKPGWRRIAFPDFGNVLTGLDGCEPIRASARRPTCRIARHGAADSSAYLYAACWLLADSTVHRLPLRPAHWLDAFNLEKANESGGAKQARGHLLVLMTARRLRQSFLAERVLPDAGGVWGMKSVEPLQLLRGSFARSSHCGRDSQR